MHPINIKVGDSKNIEMFDFYEIEWLFILSNFKHQLFSSMDSF